MNPIINRDRHSFVADECKKMDEGNHPPGEPPPGCEDLSCTYSPILIDVGSGQYKLSGLNDPVLFDINNDGRIDTLGWTSRGSAIGFLWLDINKDGIVNNGGELFGTASGARNGFEQLARYDRAYDGDVYYGGNGDGWIDSHDAVWPHLKLWIDANHDGVTQPSEILTLEDAGIQAIFLEYRSSGRVDQYGNQFRFEGAVLRRRGVFLTVSPIFDVVFVGGV